MTNEASTAARQLATLANVVEDITSRYGTKGTDLLDTLGGIRMIELAADQTRRAVAAQAKAEGHTWQEIGDATGLTRQGAQQRFGA